MSLPGCITLRTVKGSVLSWGELDSNFVCLNNSINSLASLVGNGNRWHIPSGTTLTIETDYQHFIYGDMVIEGVLQLSGNSQLVVLNGNIILSGGSIVGPGSIYNLILTGGSSSSNNLYWTSGSTGNYSIKTDNTSGLDATGDYSIATGFNTLAAGLAAYAGGNSTIANGDYQHVVGKFNTPDVSDAAFIIGNGISNVSTSNLVLAAGNDFTVYGKIITDNFQMTSGATNGYVLTSDASGNGIWQSIPSLSTSSVTGLTFNNSNFDLTLSTTTGDFIQSLSILATDMTVTGGTYNPSTGIATFTTNSGNTFNISGFLTGYTDISVSAITYDSLTGVLSLTQTDSSVLTASGFPTNDFYVTGGTLAGGTLTLERQNGTITISGFASSFTGNTSGDCITDLYVSNLNSCSPLHIQPVNSGDVYISESGGSVGIGTNTPNTSYTLDVNGDTNINGLLVTNNIQLTNGAASGYVLTSDGSGNANWLANTSVTGLTFNTGNYNLTVGTTTGDFTQSLSILSGDMTITGGTYNPSTGTATFTNNSGGTFNVSGFLTGYTDIKVTGFTYNNANTFTLTQGDNSSFSVSLNVVTGLTSTGNLIVSGKTISSNLQITSGATNGYILTSDSVGNATWQPISSIPLSGTNSILQSGNTFNGPVVIGAKDNNSVNFISGTGPISASTKMSITPSNGVTIGQNQSLNPANVFLKVGGLDGQSNISAGGDGFVTFGKIGATKQWGFSLNSVGVPLTTANASMYAQSTGVNTSPSFGIGTVINAVGTTTRGTIQFANLGSVNGTIYPDAYFFQPLTNPNVSAGGSFLSNRTNFLFQSPIVQNQPGQFEHLAVDFDLRNSVTNLGGSYPLQRDFIIRPRTHTYTTASTINEGYTLWIDGAPSGFTNANFLEGFGLGVRGGVSVTGKTKTTNFQMTSGATNGYVLTSDASGNGRWLPSSGGTGTDNYVTGGTFSNGTLTLNRQNGSVIVTGFTSTFTGNTSGTCITNLYVSNLNSCSPLHIQPINNGDVYISESGGNVGIGTTVPTKKLQVNGDGLFSSSTSNVLTIIGSGSSTSSPLFSVQGSSGQLFSISDSLIGSLFSVNDISGLPVLEAFSNSTILMGDYNAPSLNTTKKVGSVTGTTTIYSIPTSAYTGAFYDYTINDGTNFRSGNVMSVWSGSTAQYKDSYSGGVSAEIGSTAGLTFSVSINSGYANLVASATTSNWTIKTIIRSI